jgi:hypothetical protein
MAELDEELPTAPEGEGTADGEETGEEPPRTGGGTGGKQ